MTGAGVGAEGDGGAWSRSRLLAILGAASMAVALLLVGLGYTLVRAFDTDERPVETGEVATSNSISSTPGQSRRDEIAAAPMPTAPPEAARPTSSRPDDDVPEITVPDGYVLGPAGVDTGFPRTPEGAVGQLAALEAVVLEAMDLSTTAEVYGGWALAGGAGPDAWPLAVGVRDFLTGAGLDSAGSPDATVEAVPAGAIVKGTDGPDWTLACVLMEVTASLEQEQQIGLGYCERMQWVGGRWMIAPGTPPAQAPSTWPGSPAAAAAGWSTWSTWSTWRPGSDDSGATVGEAVLPLGFPRGEQGAIAMVVELNRAQVGLDLDAALATVRTYASRSDCAYFDRLATAAVSQRRASLGVPPTGDVEAPAGYAQVPVAVQAQPFGTDRVLVSVLNEVTTTTVDGLVERTRYVGQQLARWDPAAGVLGAGGTAGSRGDWRIVAPSAADRELLAVTPLPATAEPGTEEFAAAGWAPLFETSTKIGGS